MNRCASYGLESAKRDPKLFPPDTGLKHYDIGHFRKVPAKTNFFLKASESPCSLQSTVRDSDGNRPSGSFSVVAYLRCTAGNASHSDNDHT